MNDIDRQGNVLFPVFFKLHELEVLVVGGGYVGLEKLQALVKNSPDTHITLVGKEILQEDIYKLAKKYPHIKIIERKFKRKDLRDKDLVFLATNDRKLHEKIKKITRRKHIMTNVADTPDLCDFYLSSVVKKGDLKIAVSSNGKSPTLTKRIREYLEEAIPDDVQSLLDNLKEVRDQLKGDFEYKVQKLNEVTSDWLRKEKKSKGKVKDKERFEKTITAFDQANAEDPHQEKVGGQKVPKELVYGQRMSNTLAVFFPDASEELQLAARCQHIRRWEIPRDSYPMDRKGYLKWRTQLKIFHAEKAGEIMAAHGYDQKTIDRVAFLLKKQKLKSDPETQILEDVICLVFLQYYFGDFARQHPEDKVVDIVAKTWKKMSDEGHEAAKKLALSEEEGKMIEKALAKA
ncbi:DUF4202 family protein [Catalinimonas sp. 4WD22]|uniref:DUF4202 family protein n=1 Tax=Catalinimonas locisalis TaxID=3133978 RepID=UPI0031010D28